MHERLFRTIDNSPLIIFRIFFGFLLAAETYGAILTGWVYNNMVDPQFTFSHIGMDWLQPLPGYGMYFYFAAMGTLGIMVMLGYKYRLSLSLFTVLWAGAYYMQKTSYNNHYYLLLLICFIMIFLPANRYAALDAKKPGMKSFGMPAWCSWIMIFQVSIVYFYATVAKFYPGWLDGTFTRTLLQQNMTLESLRGLASQKWFYMFIAYAGIAFDMLIIPMLLYKKTRTFAFIASIIFHIFNSITLQIGIFPFFALSFVVFFYPPEKMRRIFFKKKPVYTAGPESYENKNILTYLFIPYFIIQLFLPVRHHFIKGDVLWTEEGHRLSWRMMLRFRNGYTTFKVINKETKMQEEYSVRDRLTQKQKSTMSTQPDMIWQMAQQIKQDFKAKGKDVAVYVDTRVGINGSDWKVLIDPATDLASTNWDYFFHNEWVLLYDDKGHVVK